MLWLAGILGLVAVGSAILIDSEAPEDEETGGPPDPEKSRDGLDGGYIAPGSSPDAPEPDPAGGGRGRRGWR